MFRMALDEPKPLTVQSPGSLEEALVLWQESRGTAAYLAGGCDLLDQVKSQWRNPPTLINLKSIDGLRGVGDGGDGQLRIGALTTLSALARHSEVEARAPGLVTAALRVATPQIRNLGTLGGNLLQDSRCPYYRGAWKCYRDGGIVCDAHHGLNEEHAIFGGSRCYTVTPSDTAPMLVALGATAVIQTPDGERRQPLEEVFVGPADDILHMHRLHDGEILSDILVPTARNRSVFIKKAMRNSWDFALASVAVAARSEGGKLRDVRVVLGAVAPTPWRAHSAEQVLEGASPSDSLAEEAARAATRSAEPLAHNAYKVPLTTSIVREAVKEMQA